MHPFISVVVSFVYGVGAFFLTLRLIPSFIPILIKVNLYGIDQSKRKENQKKVAEPMGLISSVAYMIFMFLFIPVPFYGWLTDDDPSFPHALFVEFVSGLLGVCCMLLLGFGDDVLELQWRHKIMMPALASLPLLMVYAANNNPTAIILPRIVQEYLGMKYLELGPLYYIYLGMFCIFCTNGINILAGVNGLEAGQSLVIAATIVVFNVIQLIRASTEAWCHLLSLYFLFPYIGTTLALLKFNWYPSEVFVGDTFCYFSGMVFAVCGLVGRFSKTVLLFSLPQLINWVFSLPQLFRLIPCPRHRLPKYDPKTDTVSNSWCQFRESELSRLGKLVFWILETFGLVAVRRNSTDGVTECSNLTLLNLFLKWFGPMHERKLTSLILIFQILCSVAALFIRFVIAGLFYDQVR